MYDEYLDATGHLPRPTKDVVERPIANGRTEGASKAAGSMVVSWYDREVARDVYARVGEMDKVHGIDRQAFDECPSQKTLDRALSSGVEDKAALMRQAASRIDTFGSDRSSLLFLMYIGETEAVRDWMASRGYVPRERYARGVSDTLPLVMEFMDQGLRRDTVLLARSTAEAVLATKRTDDYHSRPVGEVAGGEPGSGPGRHGASGEVHGPLHRGAQEVLEVLESVPGLVTVPAPYEPSGRVRRRSVPDAQTQEPSQLPCPANRSVHTRHSLRIGVVFRP